MKKLVRFLPAFLIGVCSLTSFGASGKNTAAHLKATVSENLNRMVSVDVTQIRVNPSLEGEIHAVIAAFTVDTDNRASGGVIAVVIDAADKEKFVSRYGTNLERKGDRGDGVKTESLRGTLKQITRPNGLPGPVFIDATAAGVNPDELLAKVIEAAQGSDEKLKPRR